MNVNDKLYRAADEVLQWLQQPTSGRSYRYYVSTITLFKHSGISGNNIDWLEKHLDYVRITDASDFYDSINDVIRTLEKKASDPRIPASEAEKLIRDIENAKEFIKRFDELYASVDIPVEARLASLAEQICLLAQSKCPIGYGKHAGALAESAGWETYDNGFKVYFTARHAWFAHENCTSKGKETAEHPIHVIKGYTGWSRTANRFVSVPGHVYNCHGSGHFLENAIHEVLPKLSLTGSNYIQNDGSGGIVWYYNLGMGGF